MKALADIHQRQAMLIRQSEAQRKQIANFYQQAGKPLKMAETAMNFFKSPLVLTGLAALLMKTPWRKFAWIPTFAWKGWKFLQFFKGFR